MSKAYLILENGQVFEGESFGYEKEVIAELVFSSSMTGYIELLTDPGYYGQMVVSTFPLSGNIGVIREDQEFDEVYISAYIVREYCEVPSNFRCEGDLRSFLIKNKVAALAGIDTRAIVKLIRDNGAMNAKISFNKEISEKELEEIRNYKVKDAVSVVSKREEKRYISDKEKTVVLYDMGERKSVIDMLTERFNVISVPYDSTAEYVLSLNPDGIIISDGPGDPRENSAAVEEIRKLIKADVPMFGLALGHQLIALANGFEIGKLKYGHIGSNQPVKDNASGRVYITAQNHGYFVTTDSVKDASIRFVNVNDGTCEGLVYDDGKVITVQFSIDFNEGPQNTSFLLDEFKDKM
ncbi:MAG: carbamoyl phosphate synthase small subunit [Anaerofustis stercorihominis]|nr:carbamoyl phosphate synthase small subunit [Anaerofustis stercorihominis]